MFVEVQLFHFYLFTNFQHFNNAQNDNTNKKKKKNTLKMMSIVPLILSASLLSCAEYLVWCIFCVANPKPSG